MMLSGENIVELLFDNMPSRSRDYSKRQRRIVATEWRAGRPWCVSAGVSGSERTTGVVQRSPQRSGGSRCA